MLQLKNLFLFFLLGMMVTGCSKELDSEEPTSGTGTVNGELYINVTGYFIKIKTVDSSMVWGTETRNLFASFNNPMTFDTTAYYHGNFNGITAYSEQTGQPKWSVNWYAFEDAITYRKPAFKGANVYFTSPSSMWDHGYLYCADKNSGKVKWMIQLDYGFASYPFNTTPMVVGENVIVITRDAENHKRLSAYKTDDGAEIWKSEILDDISFHLRLENDRIYSTSNKYAICINALTGQKLWQTDLGVEQFKRTATFFNQDKLIVVKVKGTEYNFVTVNINTGQVQKKSQLQIPTSVGDPDFASMGCDLSGTSAYIATRYDMDSMRIASYDLNTMAVKWEKKIKNYLYTDFTPLLTDKYLIFPVNATYPEGKSHMYFYSFDGKLVKQVPFNGNYTSGFAYKENGKMYQQDNDYMEY